MNTVDKIFEYIKENKYIDDERLVYGSPAYRPCSHEEFMVLWSYLDRHYQEQQYECADSPFPEAHLSFQYKGENYVWRVMSGQGTACQIFSENSEWHGPDVPFREDKKVVLPDNLYDLLAKDYDVLAVKEIIE